MQGEYNAHGRGLGHPVLWPQKWYLKILMNHKSEIMTGFAPCVEERGMGRHVIFFKFLHARVYKIVPINLFNSLQ
jgi:hypothetical protein